MHEDHIRILNARLPTKRAIGHGVIRDHDGRVLLCRLTYKEAWDLPGGVVEAHESPRVGCLREVREELGLDFATDRLLAVNWMSPWRGWDDACTFLFDLGTWSEDVVARMTLEAREIAGVQWCTPEQIVDRAAGATARALASVAAMADDQPPLYLEDGVPAL